MYNTGLHEVLTFLQGFIKLSKKLLLAEKIHKLWHFGNKIPQITEFPKNP